MEWRRLLFLVGLMLLVTTSASAGDLSLGIYGGYFIPADQDFKDIYANSYRFNGELNMELSRFFLLRAGVGLQTSTGELTFSGAETRLRVVPVDFGLRFRIPMQRFVPYVGAVVGIYWYMEENPIGTITDKALDLGGEAGFLLQLTGKLDLDFRFKYDYAQARPADMAANLGGMHMLMGVRYSF